MERGVREELIFRQRQPDNLEGPTDVFEASLTPVQRFFVRNHFDVPQLEPDSWRVNIDGAVNNPIKLGLEDLERFDHRRIEATIECAGNSRARLGERASGVPWKGRAIGTAEWGGVALQELLDEAGLDDEVVELVFVGADRGVIETAEGAELEMPYARSLPVEKAMSREVLVATEMNGQPLTTDHGFPARLVVPGWYGMASVKWLVRIVALTDRFDGYFQTEDYARWTATGDLVERQPLGAMEVKSHVGFPVDGQTVRPGETVTIRGFAWGGESEIEEVEVSVDGGSSYQPVELGPSDSPYAWRSWHFEWSVPEESGSRTIFSRARTVDGQVQPEEHDWSKGAYAVNAVEPVEVVITRSAS